jgi:UDP-N-acetyl-D-glucosamine dehydrogenase
VDGWQIEGEPVPRATDLDAAIGAADLVILLQAHHDYNLDTIAAAAPLLLDTRGAAPAGPHTEAL